MTRMRLQKPLKCRNANCGAMCSPANAEMWSENPEKCPNYKRDNHSEIKEIRAEVESLIPMGIGDDLSMDEHTLQAVLRLIEGHRVIA